MMYHNAEEQVRDEIKDDSSLFKLAVVENLFEDKNAKIRFIGEDTVSEKKYSYLQSYGPSIGDKVLLAKVNKTWIILGKVNYNVEPIADTELDMSKYVKFDENGSIVHIEDNGYYDQFRNILCKSNLKHEGDRLAFFGHSISTKISVSKLSTSATTAEIILKINSIINALNSYGLV